MRAAPCAAGLMLAALVLGEAAGRPPLTTGDLAALRSVSDVQLSPDATRVAYTVHNYARPGQPSADIWIRDLSAAQPVRLAAGVEPRWAPTGRAIAFLARGAVYVVDLAGASPSAQPRVVAKVSGTNHPLPSTGEELSWSPDGKQIAFVSSTPGPEGDPAGDPVVITRYLYKPPAAAAEARFNDNRRLHVFIADVAAGTVRQLTRGDHYEHSIDWSPAGDEIVFVSNRSPDPDREFNYDLFTARVTDGFVRRLTRTKSAEYHPRWSPDGSRIAYLATTRDLTSSETTMEDTHVWMMAADGSEAREAAAGIDNRHGAPKWLDNQLAFTVQEKGSVRLERVVASPGALCDCARPSPVPGAVGGWSVAKGKFAYALATPSAPAEVFVDGQKLTDLNDRVLRERAVAPTESFTFRSFDGLEVEAFITAPARVDPARKYPLVLVIHGGPHGQQGPMFNTKAQIYAGQGFASLMVNYRGSTGYGQKFADAIFGDQNGGEAKDLLAGLSAAIARFAWIDRAALFVEGGSYGGQLTNWLVTQTDRFKAAMSSAGIANLVSFNYMAYYHDYLAVEFGSYPHERGLMDKLWERSPIRYVKDVKTPVLLIHGENDNDVPIAEAEQFYIALKDAGVETVMVRYPREGHGLRETKHVADAIDRTLAWYRAHLSRRTP